MTILARMPAALALGAALLALPGAAQAQAAAEPKVNMVIVYGDDRCPESTGEEIVVCPRLDERERYRIPPNLRSSDSPSNEAWNNKVLAYETVFATGTLSCSPTGAGGFTGCTQNMIEQAYAESLGVDRYLLKPVPLQRLLDTAVELIDKLDAEEDEDEGDEQ